jgi:hypothetical protein
MRIAESWLIENGFVSQGFHCWTRQIKRKCSPGSKPAHIEIEMGLAKYVCFIHIGKHSHRVAVNSCSDLLRIIEVFENEEAP